MMLGLLRVCVHSVFVSIRIGLVEVSLADAGCGGGCSGQEGLEGVVCC